MSLGELRKRSRNANVVPVVTEFPADLLTPVSAYLRCSRSGKPSFLFESVEGGEHLARYSFLGTDPWAALKIETGQLYLERFGAKSRREVLPGNPLLAIGDYLKRFKGARWEGLPPFTGGAVGYLGYDCVRYLENIPLPDKGSAAYDASLMLFRGVIAFDHVRRSIVLVHNILLDEESLEAGYKRARSQLKKMQDMLSRPSPHERAMVFADESLRIPELKSALGPQTFAKALGKVKNHIRQGDIFQCVLSDEFSFPLKDDPFSIYRALRCTSPAPYLFHLAMGTETLLGASPEMLTRVTDGWVESCPIAGTRPRGKNETEDKQYEKQLLDSVKEKAEHLMLVDLGRNDLGRVCKPGTVSVPEFMQVRRFSNVMHLVSLVRGRLDPKFTPWQALCACFPAGTLSGAPKIRAMKIISQLEASRRGPYGGAVVYADFSGRLDSCITIRSLFVRKGTARIRAGAGIVVDSTAPREYEEILNKTKAIQKAVKLGRKA